jgi:tetratricopeptide (TPR) repeat protein
MLALQGGPGPSRRCGGSVEGAQIGAPRMWDEGPTMNAQTLIRVAVLLLTTALAACSNDEADKQRYLQSGNEFFEQKKFQEAVVQYRNAIAIDERLAEARYKLAESYAALGDGANALNHYIRAADLLPDDNSVQLKAATLLSLAGRFDDAKTRVQRVLDADPRNVQAHVLLGNILAGLRDLDGAVSQVEEAIQVDPSRGASYSSLGALRLAQGEREAARAAFDKAVSVDPSSVDARMALAVFQLQVGETADAEKTVRAALELDPRHPLANRAMFALLLMSGRAAEGEPHLKAFVATLPPDRAAFTLADYYVAMKRNDDATALLRPLTERDGTSAEANLRLARIEYAVDRPAAHRRLDGVLAKSPQHVASLLTKGSWLLAEGQPAEALQRVEPAVKAMPSNVSAHYLAGLIQAQLNDSRSAMASFNEVLRLNPRAAAAQLQLSRLQLAQGAVAETIQLAESALKNAPGNPEARLTLASGLIARRDLARAEPLVAELLKEYPNVAAVEALNGMRHLARKNIPAARAAYERALTLDPRSYPAFAGLTALDMVENKTSEARGRVEARLAATPNDVRVLMLASRVYLAVNDLGTAERTLRRVVELTPNDSRAYSMLGQLYVAQQRLPEARAEFDAMASRDPKSVTARTLAAMLSHSTQEIDDAKKRYREILAMDANAAIAANNLAWILAEEGRDLDEALRLAERAATAAPDRPEIHDTLGWVYYRKELPALAITRFEKSVSQAPDNPVYHYHLGLAHAKSGNVEQARDALNTTLKLDANHREARELLATLRD